MLPVFIDDLFAGSTRSHIKGIKVGPAGVHVDIQLHDEEWIDILCCGKLLLVRERPLIVVDTSLYIDQSACRQIPLRATISSHEYDSNLKALALWLNDGSQLIFQAVRVETKPYFVYISKWKGSNKIGFHLIEPSSE